MSSPQRLYDLIRQVRPLYRTLYRAVDDALAGSGLTVGDRAILECLHDQGPQTVPEISAQLEIERQPVQRIVDRLIEAGLLHRTSNPRSLKSPKIALTISGSRTMIQVLKREGKSLRRVAKLVDASELETAIKVIARITSGFTSHKGK